VKSRSEMVMDLLEALSYRGNLVKNDLTYFFPLRGNFPNAVIDHDSSWSVLFLKNKKVLHIHPDGRVWDDFDEIADSASRIGGLKSVHRNLSDAKFLELMVTKNGLQRVMLSEIFPDLAKTEMDNNT